MNAALCLTTLLAAVCLSSAATDEYKAKVVASLATCAKEHKVDMKEVIDVIKQDKLPQNKPQMCVAGCVMDKMGYVINSSMDWGKFKEMNNQRYESPELVEKANSVADACAKVVTGTVSDICELGEPAMKCLMEEANKVQLPKPDVKLDE